MEKKTYIPFCAQRPGWLVSPSSLEFKRIRSTQGSAWLPGADQGATASCCSDGDVMVVSQPPRSRGQETPRPRRQDLGADREKARILERRLRGRQAPG